MNHLSNGMAVAVALLITAPGWAQTPTTTSPAGTTSTTAPSYAQPAPTTMPPTGSYGQPAPVPSTPPAAPYAQQAPAQPPTASAPPSAPYSAAETSTEAMPEQHVLRRPHRRGSSEQTGSTRRTHYGTTATRTRSRGMNDNIADQLNRDEASRVSGSTMPPPAGAATGSMGAPTTGAASGAGSSAYGQPSPMETAPGPEQAPAAPPTRPLR